MENNYQNAQEVDESNLMDEESLQAEDIQPNQYTPTDTLIRGMAQFFQGSMPKSGTENQGEGVTTTTTSVDATGVTPTGKGAVRDALSSWLPTPEDASESVIIGAAKAGAEMWNVADYVVNNLAHRAATATITGGKPVQDWVQEENAPQALKDFVSEAYKPHQVDVDSWIDKNAKWLAPEHETIGGDLIEGIAQFGTAVAIPGAVIGKVGRLAEGVQIAGRSIKGLTTAAENANLLGKATTALGKTAWESGKHTAAAAIGTFMGFSKDSNMNDFNMMLDLGKIPGAVGTGSQWVYNHYPWAKQLTTNLEDDELIGRAKNAASQFVGPLGAAINIGQGVATLKALQKALTLARDSAQVAELLGHVKNVSEKTSEAFAREAAQVADHTEQTILSGLKEGFKVLNPDKPLSETIADHMPTGVGKHASEEAKEAWHRKAAEILGDAGEEVEWTEGQTAEFVGKLISENADTVENLLKTGDVNAPTINKLLVAMLSKTRTDHLSLHTLEAITQETYSAFRNLKGKGSFGRIKKHVYNRFLQEGGIDFLNSQGTQSLKRVLGVTSGIPDEMDNVTARYALLTHLNNNMLPKLSQTTTRLIHEAHELGEDAVAAAASKRLQALVSLKGEVQNGLGEISSTAGRVLRLTQEVDKTGGTNQPFITALSHELGFAPGQDFMEWFANATPAEQKHAVKVGHSLVNLANAKGRAELLSGAVGMSESGKVGAEMSAQNLADLLYGTTLPNTAANRANATAVAYRLGLLGTVGVYAQAATGAAKEVFYNNLLLAESTFRNIACGGILSSAVQTLTFKAGASLGSDLALFKFIGLGKNARAEAIANGMLRNQLNAGLEGLMAALNVAVTGDTRWVSTHYAPPPSKAAISWEGLVQGTRDAETAMHGTTTVSDGLIKLHPAVRKPMQLILDGLGLPSVMAKRGLAALDALGSVSAEAAYLRAAGPKYLGRQNLISLSPEKAWQQVWPVLQEDLRAMRSKDLLGSQPNYRTDKPLKLSDGSQVFISRSTLEALNRELEGVGAMPKMLLKEGTPMFGSSEETSRSMVYKASTKVAEMLAQVPGLNILVDPFNRTVSTAAEFSSQLGLVELPASLLDSTQAMFTGQMKSNVGKSLAGEFGPEAQAMTKGKILLGGLLYLSGAGYWAHGMMQADLGPRKPNEFRKTTGGGTGEILFDVGNGKKVGISPMWAQPFIGVMQQNVNLTAAVAGKLEGSDSNYLDTLIQFAASPWTTVQAARGVSTLSSLAASGGSVSQEQQESALLNIFGTVALPRAFKDHAAIWGEDATLYKGSNAFEKIAEAWGPLGFDANEEHRVPIYDMLGNEYKDGKNLANSSTVTVGGVKLPIALLASNRVYQSGPGLDEMRRLIDAGWVPRMMGDQVRVENSDIDVKEWVNPQSGKTIWEEIQHNVRNLKYVGPDGIEGTLLDHINHLATQTYYKGVGDKKTVSAPGFKPQDVLANHPELMNNVRQAQMQAVLDYGYEQAKNQVVIPEKLMNYHLRNGKRKTGMTLLLKDQIPKVEFVKMKEAEKRSN